LDFSDGEASWRAMTAGDLAAVGALAATVHPDLPERPEVFAEKLRLFPRGCFVLQGEGGVLGYAFAHPWRLRAIPKLDAFLGGIPAGADCLYLHDAAVAPAARGQNAAARLVAALRAVAVAEGLRWLALAAVYGAARLWGRHGFVAVEGPELDDALAGYGETARYMIAPAD
jgi:GNAT superfamily N-acetyltransferase